MSFTQLGFFTGIYGLLAMLLSVPAGFTAKRFGEKRVLAAGLVGVAIGSVLLGEAWNFESAVAFRGLTIFGYRFAFVSVLIAVALTAPPQLRGRTMGVLGATSAMASVDRRAARRRARRRVRLAHGDPGLRGDGAGRRRRVLAVLSRRRRSPTPRRPRRPRHRRMLRAAPFARPWSGCSRSSSGSAGSASSRSRTSCRASRTRVYGLDAAAAGVIISTGYLAAIVLNLVIGMLADRFNKLVVLGGMFVAARGRVGVAGHRARARVPRRHGRRDRLRLLGGESALRPRRQLDAAPRSRQRDGHREPRRRTLRLSSARRCSASCATTTGSFAAGFYMVAVADLLTLGLIVLLYRMTRRTQRDRRRLRCIAAADRCSGRATVARRRSAQRRRRGTDAPPTGDQHRTYLFAPTGARCRTGSTCRPTWDGKRSLPILLFLHGAGANESTYLDMADGLLRKLAEQHGYIVVSPLGFTPLGAYGNPLRLPAVFGDSARRPRSARP